VVDAKGADWSDRRVCGPTVQGQGTRAVIDVGRGFMVLAFARSPWPWGRTALCRQKKEGRRSATPFLPTPNQEFGRLMPVVRWPILLRPRSQQVAPTHGFSRQALARTGRGLFFFVAAMQAGFGPFSRL